MSRRIALLETTNLKGRSLTIPLSANNIVEGGNATGKSSVLDAIKLALLGEHDTLGKQGKSLMGLASDDEASAKVTFDDGEESIFTIKARGTTAKVNHNGLEMEPAVRLNLCPEEFWGKGTTARAETLLQMCGDATLVNQNFIKTCIERVRVQGMTTEGENNDRQDIKEMGAYGFNQIRDGDISSLAEVEKHFAEIRRERGQKVKQLHAQLESAETSVEPLDEERIRFLNLALSNLLQEGVTQGELLAKAKAGKKRLAELKKKQNAFIADRDTPEVDTDAQIKLADRKVQKSLLDTKQTNLRVQFMDNPLMPLRMHEMTEGNKPNQGETIKVDGDAIWTGSAFVLINDSITWKPRGDTEIEEVETELAEVGRKLHDINNEICGLQLIVDESEGSTAEDLTQSEHDELGLLLEADFDGAMQQYNNRISHIEDTAKEHREELNQNAGIQAERSLRERQENEASEAERKHANIKAVVKTIRDTQNDIVSQAIDRCLDIVNKVTKRIVATPIEWDGATLGRHTEGGAWVSIDTFSGAEKAVTQMALGVALASRSSFKLAILDEVSRLDLNNKSELISNLKTLVSEGHIDQWIAFTIDPIVGSIQGEINRIDMANVNSVEQEAITPETNASEIQATS